MLSKKMTFSLMSLITLLALAFVAPTAMAADFSTTVTQVGSLSYQLNTAGNGLDTEPQLLSLWTSCLDSLLVGYFLIQQGSSLIPMLD